MKVCPKGGGFDTKMLDFHFENLQLSEELSPISSPPGGTVCHSGHSGS